MTCPYVKILLHTIIFRNITQSADAPDTKKILHGFPATGPAAGKRNPIEPLFEKERPGMMFCSGEGASMIRLTLESVDLTAF
jgi:hypothetical protein